VGTLLAMTGRYPTKQALDAEAPAQPVNTRQTFTRLGNLLAERTD
jgi:hypothetical protein